MGFYYFSKNMSTQEIYRNWSRFHTFHVSLLCPEEIFANKFKAVDVKFWHYLPLAQLWNFELEVAQIISVLLKSFVRYPSWWKQSHSFISVHFKKNYLMKPCEPWKSLVLRTFKLAFFLCPPQPSHPYKRRKI